MMEIERMARLLCKLEVDWPNGRAAPDTVWRAMRAETKEGFRTKARWLLEQLARPDDGTGG